MKKNPSKRYKKIKKESVDKKIDSIDDAIKYVKANCTAKFDESIDVSFNLNLKKKKEEVSLRTTVNLPHGNGKKIKVAVLCEESKIKEAKEAGADLSGSDNLVKDIIEGKAVKVTRKANKIPTTIISSASKVFNSEPWSF